MRGGGRGIQALACSLLPVMVRGFSMRWATESKCLLILIGIGLLSATRAGAVDGNSIIDTLAGGGNGDGFPAAVASVDPDTVSVGPDGSIYVAESSQHRIRRINPQSGFIETFAGIGS